MEEIYERNGKKYTRQQLEAKYGPKVDDAITNFGFKKIEKERLMPVEEYEFNGQKFSRKQLEDKYGAKTDDIISTKGFKNVSPQQEYDNFGNQPAAVSQPVKKKENADLLLQDPALVSSGNTEVASGSSVSEKYPEPVVTGIEDQAKQEAPIQIPVEGDETEVGFFKDLWNETVSGITRTMAGAYGIKNFLNKQEASLLLSVMPDKYSEALNKMTPKQREIFINNAVNVTSPIGKLAGQISAEAQDELTAKTNEIAARTIKFEGNIVDDIANGNYAQAGQRTLKGVANSASSVALAISPGGLFVIGAGTAAQKQETLEEEGEDINVRTVLNATINGAAEGFMERYTGKIAGSTLKALRGKAEAAKHFSEGIVKTILKDIGIEAGSEFATSIIQDLSDKIVQGREISLIQIMKNAADGAIIGGVMGGGMSAPKGIAGYVAHKTMKKEKQNAINDRTAEAIQIENTLENPELSDQVRSILEKKAESIRNEVKILQEGEIARAESMTDEQVKDMFQVDKEVSDLVQDIVRIEENESIDPQEKESLLKILNSELDGKNQQLEQLQETEFEKLPVELKERYIEEARELYKNYGDGKEPDGDHLLWNATRNYFHKRNQPEIYGEPFAETETEVTTKESPKETIPAEQIETQPEPEKGKSKEIKFKFAGEEKVFNKETDIKYEFRENPDGSAGFFATIQDGPDPISLGSIAINNSTEINQSSMAFLQSYVPQNSGIGFEMYKNMAQMAAKEGIAIHSDHRQSPQARRVWEKLEEAGLAERLPKKEGEEAERFVTKLPEPNNKNTGKEKKSPTPTKKKQVKKNPEPELKKNLKEVTHNKGTFTVETGKDGKVKIFKKDGTEVTEYTSRKLKGGKTGKVKNGIYSILLAKATNSQTDNQINAERKKLWNNVSDQYQATTPTEIAELALANGVKISRESVTKETGENSKKLTWATGIQKEGKAPSVEKLAEDLAAENQDLGFDDYAYRNAIIDVLMSYESVDGIRDALIERHQQAEFQANEDALREEMNASIGSLTEEQLSLLDAADFDFAIDQLSEAERKILYTHYYERQIESLPEEEQGRLYKAPSGIGAPGVLPQTRSNESSNRKQSSRTKSPELREVEQQLEQAQADLSRAQTALKNKAKLLDQTLMEDQPDIFGKRKSQTPDKLFDERVDIKQRNTATAKERQAIEDAQENLRNLREKRRYLLDGNGTTEAMEFPDETINKDQDSKTNPNYIARGIGMGAKLNENKITGFYGFDQESAINYAEGDIKNVLEGFIPPDAKVLRLVENHLENEYDWNEDAISEFTKILGSKNVDSNDASDITEVLWGEPGNVKKLIKAGYDVVIGNTIDGPAAYVLTDKGIQLRGKEEVGVEQASTRRTTPKSKTFSLNGQSTFYHASGKKRQGRLKKGTAENFGEAVYFSTDKDGVAGQFGSEVSEVKLAIENPLYTDSKEITKVYDEALRRADKEYIQKRKALNRWTANDEIDLEENGYIRFSPADHGDLAEINAKHISDAAQDLGYDAIIDKDSMDYENEIAVLDESKIIYPEDSGYDQASQARTNALVTERIKPEKRTAKSSPKKLPEIIAKVAKDLIATLIYGRSGRARSIGTYSPSNTLVRIKNAGDIDTVAHELGHYLDDRFDIIGTIPSNMELAAIRQLKWFSERGGSNPPGKLSKAQKQDYLQREGLAELIRAFVANPTQARIVAPELLQHFENTVDKKTLESLKEFSDSYLDIANATAGERILANVESSNLKDKPGFKKWVEKFQGEDGKLNITPFDRINSHLLNSMGIAEKAFSFLTELSGKENLRPSQNFEVMARVFAGFNGKVHRALSNGLVDHKNRPLTDSKGDAMNVKWLLDPLENTSEATIKKEMDEVIALLVAERTMEYAKKFRRLDDLTGIGAGLNQDIEVAQNHLNEFKDLKNTNIEKYDRIKEAARRYREFADAGLKYAVGKGRISKDAYQTIKESNEYYAALTRVQENAPTEEALAFVNETGGSISSSREIIHKAKGGTGFIQNPYVSLLQNTVAIMRESDRNEVMQSFVEPLTQLRNMGDGTPIDFSQIARPAQAGDKNTRTVYVNGQRQNWQFAEDIYKSLASLEGVAKNPIVDLMAKPAQVIRFTVTRFPTFALRNATRDTFSRMVVSRTNSGFKDLLHNADDKALFELYGGSQAGFYLLNKDSYRETLREAVKEITNKGGIVLDPRIMGTKYFELLERGENLNRIAEFKSAYRKAKKEGLDDYDAGIYAAYQARDLMDFAVAGHTIRTLNKMIPFLNAQVQGLRRTAKAAKENPTGFAVRTALYTVLPTIAFRALVSSMGDDEEYEQLPGYQRDIFWNFKTPATGDKWITIPKPFEQGLISSTVDRLISKTQGVETAFEGFSGTLSFSFMPFDEASMLGGMKPLFEASVNHNMFTDRPIVPQWEEGKMMELRNGAKDASRVGEGLSTAFKKAGMSVDPRKIDHVIQGYGTYMADWGLSLSELGVEDSRFRFTIAKTGFARDIPMTNSIAVSKVYELATELGKWNDSRIKSLRSDIEKFYEAEDAKARKELSSDIYKKAEKLRAQFEADKKKIKEPETKTETRGTGPQVTY